jgi:hypothetical protein
VITTGQPRRAASPSIDLHTAGAPCAYTTADVEPPSSRDAAWGGGGIIAADMHRGTWKACRKLSENQTQLDPRAAPPSALRPPPRPPPPSPARAARRLSRPLVCAWRPRVTAQVDLSGVGRSCVDGAVQWAPREPMTVPWSKVGGRRALPRSPSIWRTPWHRGGAALDHEGVRIGRGPKGRVRPRLAAHARRPFGTDCPCAPVAVKACPTYQCCSLRMSRPNITNSKFVYDC